MTDSCGPSNALKSLQRQFDSDRSLHQSQQYPAHQQANFRTQPGQEQFDRATREYEQFLGSSRSQDHPLDHVQRDRFVQADPRQQQWASDFHTHQASALHVSQHQQQQHLQAQQSQQVTGWGAEFMAMRNQQIAGPDVRHQYLPSTISRQAPYIPAQQGIFSPAPAQTQTHTQIHTQDQDRVFAQAFEQAEQSMQSVTLDNAPDLVHASASHTYEEDMTNPESQVEAETKRDLDRRLEADALADTAGELIQALHHEKSDKFKNSNFMALMHKLRDREVVVDGDRMISAHTGERIDTNHEEHSIVDNEITTPA